MAAAASEADVVDVVAIVVSVFDVRYDIIGRRRKNMPIQNNVSIFSLPETSYRAKKHIQYLSRSATSRKHRVVVIHD
jgi:hypothetical protein